MRYEDSMKGVADQIIKKNSSESVKLKTIQKSSIGMTNMQR